jgi:hypothetical protein
MTNYNEDGYDEGTYGHPVDPQSEPDPDPDPNDPDNETNETDMSDLTTDDISELVEQLQSTNESLTSFAEMLQEFNPDPDDGGDVSDDRIRELIEETIDYERLAEEVSSMIDVPDGAGDGYDGDLRETIIDEFGRVEASRRATEFPARRAGPSEPAGGYYNPEM